MPNPTELDGFELLPDRAVFRPVGEVSLSVAVALITAAVQQARERRQSRLLVVTTGLTGFNPPDVAARYFMVRAWAAAGAGQVRLSMVARPEMIDPERFGLTAAANAGLSANIFTSEAEALEWLMQPD